MLIRIPTKAKRFTLELGLKAHYPLQLGVAVFDPSCPNTYYCKRRVNFKSTAFAKGIAYRKLSIPFPVCPQHLQLAIYEKGGREEGGFKLSGLTIQPLEKMDNWATPRRHRFMDFAIRFAQKAGYAPTGYYSSPKEEFLIHYKPKLVDQEGKELVTPARIHRKVPWIQLSQHQFKQFSVPVRIAILAHEGCHFFNNTRSEKEADLCGLQYYLDAGFPRIEAVYAITKVFRFFDLPIEEEHLQRARDIIQFATNYQKNKDSELSTLTEIE